MLRWVTTKNITERLDMRNHLGFWIHGYPPTLPIDRKSWGPLGEFGSCFTFTNVTEAF